jgi:hypothetical protein
LQPASTFFPIKADKILIFISKFNLLRKKILPDHAARGAKRDFSFSAWARARRDVNAHRKSS